MIKRVIKQISIKQGKLADTLPLGKKVKRIDYKKKKVTIFVNECAISISRDATKLSTDSDGKGRVIKTQGKILELRFIVERLVNDNFAQIIIN